MSTSTEALTNDLTKLTARTALYSLFGPQSYHYLLPLLDSEWTTTELDNYEIRYLPIDDLLLYPIVDIGHIAHQFAELPFESQQMIAPVLLHSLLQASVKRAPVPEWSKLIEVQREPYHADRYAIFLVASLVGEMAYRGLVKNILGGLAWSFIKPYAVALQSNDFSTLAFPWHQYSENELEILILWLANQSESSILPQPGTIVVHAAMVPSGMYDGLQRIVASLSGNRLSASQKLSELHKVLNNKHPSYTVEVDRHIQNAAQQAQKLSGSDGLFALAVVPLVPVRSVTKPWGQSWHAALANLLQMPLPPSRTAWLIQCYENERTRFAMLEWLWQKGLSEVMDIAHADLVEDRCDESVIYRAIDIAIRVEREKFPHNNLFFDRFKKIVTHTRTLTRNLGRKHKPLHTWIEEWLQYQSAVIAIAYNVTNISRSLATNLKNLEDVIGAAQAIARSFNNSNIDIISQNAPSCIRPAL